MRTPILAILAAAALAGCVNLPEPTTDPVAAAEDAAEDLAPVRVEWKGLITHSALGLVAHRPETEPRVGMLQREGFVLDITEIPQDLFVELAWPGPGMALIMVSTPRDAQNAGGEYFTEMSAEESQCLRVPPEELETGKWQVMIHTRDASRAEFTFTVVTLGGAGAILDEPHSSAEAANPEGRDALPCATA